MSEHDEDLELQALQRQLDDAFQTTRPRRGFEDDLWLRMQASRPATNRLRDAIAGLLQGIREVPAVPAAAVAALLVVVIGVGLLAYSGVGRGGGGGGTALSQAGGESRGSNDFGAGDFGRLPSPVFDGGKQVAVPAATGSPLQYVWAGRLSVGASTALVYRYREPSTNVADQFASSLGAVLRERPQGLLGSYSTSTYTLNIRPTIQRPVAGPTYFIISSPSMPVVDAAGAGPADVATIFLAQHSLVPDWAYAVKVDAGGDPVKVLYGRQFDVPGYGAASLVDPSGDRYGVEVDLKGNRPILVAGMLPVSLDAAGYRIVSPDDAIRPLLSVRATNAASPPPTVQLTQAELVYVLVPAGDHSFYEPAYLFSGKSQVNGATVTNRVLVAAVDPSQRSA